MSDFSLTLVLRLTTSKIINDVAKVQIKSEKITPFGGIFHVRELFSRYVGPVIDEVFHQQDTLERIYSNLESENIHIKRSRMDCGSCSREIVETVEKHSELFYIRANRCGSLYDSLFALRGWQREQINGIGYELNSIIVEKWEGKAYRLVIQRERRLDGEQDL